MSLPIAGGNRPTRPPTHKPVDSQKLLKLGMAIDDAAEGQHITHDALDQLAGDEAVATELAYAALATTSDAQLTRQHPVAFLVCAGGCQQWGSISILAHLVARRAKAGDGKAFDIVAKKCLDRCSHAAAVIVESPDGRAVIDQATEAKIDEALAAVL